MTDREFFIETLADESPRFVRVFKALPVKKLSHTHHERSKTAEQLVTQMTGESKSFLEFLKTGKTDWSVPYKAPKKFASMFTEFAKNLKTTGAIAKKMTEKEWSSKAIAFIGKRKAWETTRGKMAWGLLLDLIHHRGQLSTYIRPMGGKVPSIYGPSGDSNE